LKQAGAILMFSLLFYTQMGYYGQFMVLQWQMKEAAREAWIAALPDTALFRVSLAEVNASGKWEEAGKECWYNDHLYDVIRQRTIDGKSWLFCLDDEREASLIRQSGAMTGASHDHPDKKTGHSLTVRIGDVLPGPGSLRIGHLPLLRLYVFGYEEHPLPTSFSEIVIPPPKG
jgi:hypothetical protein